MSYHVPQLLVLQVNREPHLSLARLVDLVHLAVSTIPQAGSMINIVFGGNAFVKNHGI
jgi:hypothetical protein